jgi:hypothetical protein
VRREKNDQVSSLWHVVREGAISNLAYKRDPCESSHVEALASHSAQAVVQTVWVVVYLVGADAGCEERVGRGTAFFDKSKVDALVKLNGKLSLGEVFLNLSHRVFLHIRVV